MTILQAIRAAKTIQLAHCDLNLAINKKQARDVARTRDDWISPYEGDDRSGYELSGDHLHITLTET